MPVTRFHFPTGTTAPISPARDGSWNGQAGLVRGRLVTTRLNSTASTVAGTIAGPDNDNVLLQFISDPISTAGAATLASSPGTVKAIIRAQEGTATSDCRAQMVIRILSNDGTVVRGVLLADDGSALSNEWATTLTNRRFPLNWGGAGAALTAVASAVANDRIVVEVGFRTHRASGNATGTLSYGDASATDLAENETGTVADSAWIEFSADVFDAGAPAPRRAELAWAEMEVPSSVPQISSVLKLYGHHYDDGSVKSDAQLANMDWVNLQRARLTSDPGLVGRLRTLNPDIIVTVYWFPQLAATFFANWTTLNANDGWFLHSPNEYPGSTGDATRVQHDFGGSSHRLMDMRVSAYRNYERDYLMNTWVLPYALNGIYNDGPNITSGFHHYTPWIVAPTAQQITDFNGDRISATQPNVLWFTEMKTALAAAVSPNVLIQNSMNVWNAAANYSDTSQFLDPGRADGTFFEGAFHYIGGTNGHANTLVPETTQIDHVLTNTQAALNLGKYVVNYSGCNAGTVAERDARRNFCFAMYLMQAEGTLYYFSWTRSGGVGFPVDGDITYFNDTANSLGAPRGTYFTEAGTTSVLRRDFNGGYVRANKNETQTQAGLLPQRGEIVLTPSTDPRAVQLAWAEVEVPEVTANRAAQLAWAEMEIPDLASRAVELAWAEMEIPSADRAVQLAWAEMEVPDIPVPPPNTNRFVELAWAEVEVPSPGVTPSGDRRVQVAWAEMEIPSVSGETEVPSEFGSGEFPDPGRTQFDSDIRPFPDSPTHPTQTPRFP